MENTKTNYQYLHTDDNWYPIEIRKCSTAMARGTINQGRPYQPVYIRDGKEYTIRYRRSTVESAIAGLQTVVQNGDGTSNDKRYRLVPGVNREPEGPKYIRLFVYGTLKRGYWNHELFCKDAVSIEEATVRGRLYELPSGIPVLEVPGEDILAVGIPTSFKDMVLQDSFRNLDMLPAGLDGWHDIRGELITLADPELTVPLIDQLEGFSVGARCMYHRVLLTVIDVRRDLIPAWCYIGTPFTLRHSCPSGRNAWPQ